MDKKEFVRIRKELKKTQKELSELLGTSLKAIHSYEQGWRNVPAHAERQLLFLFSQKNDVHKTQKQCWEIKECPPERKHKCPAWEFQLGTRCWFVNGTICEGTPRKNWREKIEMCRSCEIFMTLFESQNNTTTVM